MDSATLTSSRPVVVETTALPTVAEELPGRRARRVAPLLAMGSGVVVLAMAATLLVSVRPMSAPAPVPVVADPTAITLSARDISVVSQVYGPGDESGWHAHSGIHAVAVLSGVLTVYDAQCHRQTFEPGRPYVGGQDLHLVRNETDAPVGMTVTYLNPSTGAGPTRHLPAPAGCTVGVAS